MKRIIVLGAGYGGILTAKKLGKKLRNHHVSITLIDRNPYHTLLTLLHEVAGNRADEQLLKVDLKTVFAGFKQVDVVKDHIIHIDFAEKILRGEDEEYSYDYLVIGTGSKPTYFGVPGAEQFTLSLWSYEDAIKIKAHVIEQFRQAVHTKDERKRQQLLTFVIVGAGFTGVEMAGELAEFVQQLCRQYRINREEVTLNIVDMADSILPYFPKKLISKAANRLRDLGVNIITQQTITEVTAEAVHLNGHTIPANTVIWTAGIEGSQLVTEMDIEQAERKRIVINEHLQVPAHSEVYVVGDNMYFIPEGETRPVPQMVENCEQAAALVAHNLVAAIKGKPLKRYKPTFHGTMVCIGSRYGVAHVGLPKMMIPLSGWLAMFVKHMINMLYLLQVGGINLMVEYMRHEFVNVQDNRSFIGGLAAKQTPSVWLVPLRLLLGGMWLAIGWQAWTGNFHDHGLITAMAQHLPGNVWSVITMLLAILLIIGLFTLPAALILTVIGIVIWFTGAGAQTAIWYIIGGITLFGGAGNTLGLDYYVLPHLKAAWRKIPFVKRWYLYID